MGFTTFKQYCESQDATVGYTPHANSGFVDDRNRSFEQVVDPLIADFVQKILHNSLNEYTPKLNPAQIEYVLNKLRQELGNIQYDANKDLGKMVSNLFRQGNRAGAIPTPRDSQQQQGVDTPLATVIGNLFNRKR